ncbi:pentapeptide repeat-containing protein [Leptolyngbya sp. FACHB-541]|uniref:pentapeptide repeat-containing protein n=1 Tax=Leptolyngbya sp. FACHB-541 TaxID=2692810 RepID=UPI00168277B2|nr:pentapeptide repeat-containing protein [Leptolyngbya sp. FACHB-541]
MFFPDLSEAKLDRLDLRGINFKEVNLTEAQQTKSVLIGADLEKANFSRSPLYSNGCGIVN